MSYFYNPQENKDSNIKIIAEIGCNHKGSIEIAMEMIKVAQYFCGADYVKFQKRCNKALLTQEEYDAPHPDPHNAYGDTYGSHREYLEFSPEQHKELKAFCDSTGIGYSSSVWDAVSAREIAGLNPDFIKIPSACNLNNDVLEYLLKNFSGDVHISLGMTTQKEEQRIVDLFEQNNASERLVIYACTSGYPVPFEHLALREIERLERCHGTKAKAIGFSGHHNGIAADVAAMTLGAKWIERHYTLNRTWKGTDHAASLEPDGLRRLVRDLHNIETALTYKKEEILEIEVAQRKKLKRIKGIHY